MQKFISSIILLLSSTLFVFAQNRTCGLISYNGTATEGYNFIYPINQATAYLINNCGEIVNTWPDSAQYMSGPVATLTSDGKLLKTKRKRDFSQDKIFAPGAGAIVELRNWENDIEWSFALNNQFSRLHHDIEIMPNGNFLFLIWDLKTKEECIKAGRDTLFLPEGRIFSERIIEINPKTNEIVWEWSVWDHLIQDFDPNKENFGSLNENPGKVNINTNKAGITGLPNADWMHINSMDYNSDLDQILFSVPTFGEIMIIDHSTSTAQAKTNAGGLGKKGGDILYRWGNEKNYNPNSTESQKLFFQHDARWLNYLPINNPDRNKISIFNNRLQPNSLGYTLSLPWDMYIWGYTFADGKYGPKDVDKIIKHPIPSKQQSAIASSIQFLDNGNIMACAAATGYAYELNKQGEVIWEYVLPYKGANPVEQGTLLIPNDNPIFNTRKYLPDFIGFQDKELSPKGYIELLPDSTFCNRILDIDDLANEHIKIYPNPVNDILNIESKGEYDFEIYSFLGVKIIEGKLNKQVNIINITKLKSGLYFFKTNNYIKTLVKD